MTNQTNTYELVVMFNGDNVVNRISFEARDWLDADSKAKQLEKEHYGENPPLTSFRVEMKERRIERREETPTKKKAWRMSKEWWIVLLLFGGYWSLNELIKTTRQEGFERGMKCSQVSWKEGVTTDSLCAKWWSEENPVQHGIESQKDIERTNKRIEELLENASKNKK